MPAPCEAQPSARKRSREKLRLAFAIQYDPEYTPLLTVVACGSSLNSPTGVIRCARPSVTSTKRKKY